MAFTYQKPPKEFQYLTPLEPTYFGGTPQALGGQGTPKLEEPIVPVHELGVTVPESDPRTGAHILQNVQAAIRSGAKELQIVMTTPSTSAIGGRPKAYGKEVREAIKEVALASGVNIRGVEMPTSSMSNLSGFDPQRGTISDQKRNEDLQEVKDALQFVADVSGGGGVDIWSQEFPRTIFDAEWNKKGDFKDFDKEEEQAVKHLVDRRTGRLIDSIRMNQEVAYPVWNHVNKGDKYIDKQGNERVAAHRVFVDIEGHEVDLKDRVPMWDPETRQFKVEHKNWKYFAEEEAKLLTEARKQELGSSFNPEIHTLSPEEAFFVATTTAQEAVSRGWAQTYSSDVEDNRKELEKLRKAREVYEQIESQAKTEEEKQMLLREVPSRISQFVPPDYKKPTAIIDDQITQLKQRIASSTEQAKGQLQQALDLKKQSLNVTSAEKYAKARSVESYAELGLYAYQETRNRGLQKDLYVGPELGWPGAWGGHPKEFIELVKKSRNHMADLLVQKEHLSASEAQNVAKKHIKGLFDTSHMGMWLNKFRRKDGESEEQRLKAFNRWYGEMVDELVKEDVVGSIQAVDSATGAHGHLPPGQGIFPVVDAVKKFKNNPDWKGWIVSEGHEEERFGANRILLKTWEAFGSPLHRGGPGARTWGQVTQSHYGNVPPPYFITQSYVPVNDFKLWSEVQLE